LFLCSNLISRLQLYVIVHAPVPARGSTFPDHLSEEPHPSTLPSGKCSDNVLYNSYTLRHSPLKPFLFSLNLIPQRLLS
jgi:hypothetical protein